LQFSITGADPEEIGVLAPRAVSLRAAPFNF
jgi:hypothetical protein